MLPPLHARWLAELALPLPLEGRATCDACPMVSAPDVAFNATSKCCTFMPDLPSFSVGALLADPDPALGYGRDRVRERIAGGVGVTPLGVSRPRAYRVLYGGHSFGRSDALVCPYFVPDRGRCGVWRHREATCATWFCKHERGLVGDELWTRVRRLLGRLELGLTRWVAIELGIPAEALDVLTAPPPVDDDADDTWCDLDRNADRDFYDGVWCAWAGREEAFYDACRARVHALAATDALAHAGAGASLLVEDARRALAAHAELGPPRLYRIRDVHRLADDGATARLASYSPYDPVEVPSALAAALAAGDTRGLAPELGRTLADFGVLWPAGEDREP